LNVSIGILAYNESGSISATLLSLFQQSLLNQSEPNCAIEVVVVPNGCTDETASVARAKLEELVQTVRPGVRAVVCEVEQSGKSNAWNLYVHEFSDPAADYLFLMDADIKFLEPHTLRHMIEILEATPSAWVSVDTPVKDVEIKEKKNLLERLSVSVSKGGSGVAICGQLYCGRASVLRGIWMPPGLPVEDGFLAAMIVTDRFTSKEVFERIVRAEAASHVFEAYTNPITLLRHEQRIIVGSTINAFIYGDLWANCNQEQDAGSLIKSRNEQDPLWVNQFLQQSYSKHGWWLIPKQFLFRRFDRLRNYSPFKAILRFPLAIAAFIVDLMVFFQANRRLHKESGLGYWG